jgi:hypothetical protein
MTESDYTYALIEQPGDGSCFYHCIASAFESCKHIFNSEFRRNINAYMLAYLYSRNQITVEQMNQDIAEQHTITANLIRYICGTNIDNDDLEVYNAMLAADDQKTVQSKEELADAIMNSDIFADFIELRILMTKAFNQKLGIVVFDNTVDNGIVYMPAEWTRNKPYNILLLRDNEHYTLIRVTRNNTRLGTLVDSFTAQGVIQAFKCACDS